MSGMWKHCRDTRPARMDSDTRRAGFGESSDVLFEYDGGIYIVTTSIIVPPGRLFDIDKTLPARWSMVTSAFCF